MRKIDSDASLGCRLRKLIGSGDDPRTDVELSKTACDRLASVIQNPDNDEFIKFLLESCK